MKSHPKLGELHYPTVALNAKAEAVILDLMKPLGAGRNFGSRSWDAELKRFKHAPKIGVRAVFCQLSRSTAPAGLGASARWSIAIDTGSAPMAMRPWRRFIHPPALFEFWKGNIKQAGSFKIPDMSGETALDYFMTHWA